MQLITFFEFVIQAFFKIIQNQAIIFDLIAIVASPTDDNDDNYKNAVVNTAKQMSKDNDDFLRRYIKITAKERSTYYYQEENERLRRALKEKEAELNNEQHTTGS